MPCCDRSDWLVRIGKDELPRLVCLGDQRDQLLITGRLLNGDWLLRGDDQAKLVAAADPGGRAIQLDAVTFTELHSQRVGNPQSRKADADCFLA